MEPQYTVHYEIEFNYKGEWGRIATEFLAESTWAWCSPGFPERVPMRWATADEARAWAGRAVLLRLGYEDQPAPRFRLVEIETPPPMQTLERVVVW